MSRIYLSLCFLCLDLNMQKDFEKNGDLSRLYGERSDLFQNESSKILYLNDLTFAYVVQKSYYQSICENHLELGYGHHRQITTLNQKGNQVIMILDTEMVAAVVVSCSFGSCTKEEDSMQDASATIRETLAVVAHSTFIVGSDSIIEVHWTKTVIVVDKESDIEGIEGFSCMGSGLSILVDISIKDG